MSSLKLPEQRPLFGSDGTLDTKFAVIALLALGLMVCEYRFQRLDALRSALDTALYPLQYAIQLPFATAAHWGEVWASRQALVAENRRLRQKQLLVDAQLQRLAALEAENRRLRLLLKSAVPFRERALIGELVAMDFDPYRHQILVDKGFRQGVYVGQPLVAPQGVVGQVVHVAPFTARAILITDPSHALPVQVNRNGLRTLAVGTGQFGELALPHIPNGDLAEVQVGDLLVTSGLGGRFPRGYPVARISQVAYDAGRPFAKVRATPISDLDRLREVLLIFRDETDALPVPPPLPTSAPAAADGRPLAKGHHLGPLV
ncbi:MAG: rod shape-determining protein MreC [Candidatus Competibacterales bacterium]